MPNSDFVPFDPQINPDDLIKLDAGHGPFYVCSAGALREVGSIIFYGDDQDQFFVYANTDVSDDENILINVFGANLNRGGGRPIRIPRTRRSVIESSLSLLLLSRNGHSIKNI